MALSANRNLEFYASAELIDVPVVDNVKIYKGAFVGQDASTGYARPLQAGDTFLGVAYQQADNTIDGHTAGGITVRLHQNIDIVHTLTGVGQTHVGMPVFASADNTLTLTAASNSRVGRVLVVEGTNSARVRCQPVGALNGLLEGTQAVTLADASATLTSDHLNRTLLIGNTAARTLTLPAVAGAPAGTWLRVIKTSAAAFAVTLDGASSETINGSTTYAGIDAQYDTALLVSTGSEWIIASRDIA